MVTWSCTKVPREVKLVHSIKLFLHLKSVFYKVYCFFWLNTTLLCFMRSVHFTTSHAYFKLTKSYNITPSMSRKGNPYDNALAENFFSILKTECIYRIKLKTYDETRLIYSFLQQWNNTTKNKTDTTRNAMFVCPELIC